MEVTGRQVFVVRDRANQQSGQDCCPFYLPKGFYGKFVYIILFYFYPFHNNLCVNDCLC